MYERNSNYKAIVVGRHSGELPGYSVYQRPAQFPADYAGTAKLYRALCTEAHALGRDACLLFQAIPGQLAVVMATESTYPLGREQVGVIVSTPGDRQSGVEKSFYNHDDPDDNSGSMAQLEAAVAFTNPNARISRQQADRGFEVVVTVDPPMKFVLNRIIWLDGDETEF